MIHKYLREDANHYITKTIFLLVLGNILTFEYLENMLVVSLQI
ncbi:unnamed protein product [Arabidopsis halleri]